MRRRILMALAVLASGAIAVSAQPGNVYTLNNLTLKVDGKFGADDAKVKFAIADDKFLELPAKTFDVKLQARRMYLITMAGTVLDATTVIQDGKGKPLAFDDGEGGKFYDALIYFSPAKDDVFKVIAATRKNEGPFSLIFDDIGTVQSDVQKVSPSLQLEGKLDRVTRSITYPVKLDAGKTYIIDMTSPDADKLDPYLYFLDPKDKKLKEDDDSGGGRNARLTMRVPTTGVYKIIAASFQWKGEGPFTVSVRGLAAGIAATIKKGAFSDEGKLLADDPKDLLLNQSPYKTYNLKFAAGKTYTIDLQSDDFDAFLRLEDATGKQLAFDDDSGGGSNARLVFQAANSGDYQVFVTSLDKKAGSYRLKIQEK